jgi:hypothetical protein
VSPSRAYSQRVCTIVSDETARPMKRMRIASGAAPIPQRRFQAWHDQAVLTPGLTELDRKVLGVIAAWYRRLCVESFAGSLSYERMGNAIGAIPRDVRFAVSHLIKLGLIGVERGAGARANHSLPALPRSVAARLTGAVVDEAAPPF